jgi:hypothetical protein
MELKIRKYLPHAMKAALVNSIVDICCTEENGIIVYDHMMRELFFGVALIENYTDYNFTVDDNGDYVEISSQYDKLVEDGTMDKVIDSIGKDYFLLLESLDREIENRLKQNTIEYVIAKNLQKLIEMLDKRLDAKNLKAIVRQLEKISPETFKTILEINKSK